MYQRDNQKISNGQSEYTKGPIRRYQMGNQNIPKNQSEAVTYACRIRKVSRTVRLSMFL